MAKVFQIIATDPSNDHFDGEQVNGDWHASYYGDAPRTVCGLQLEGDDGIAPGPIKDGRVTCDRCRHIIKQIQAIKQWR